MIPYLIDGFLVLLRPICMCKPTRATEGTNRTNAEYLVGFFLHRAESAD